MKIGIVGCGGIAHAHVGAYKSLGCQIVGLTDCNVEASRSLAAGIDGAVVYESYQDLIDGAGCDAVSICTPPVWHEEAAVYALQRGVHVLCEKPMAHDVKAAHAMRDAAQNSSALLMLGFRHRFIPANMLLRDMVRSGDLGDIVLFNNIFCGPAFSMEGKWFTQKAIAGGGTLLDTNSHSVDLFRFIVGEVVDQKAVMHRHFRTTDVEDAGILTLKSESNAIGSVQSTFVAGAGVAYIDIIGTKGRAIFDYLDGDKVRFRKTEDSDWTVKEVTANDGFLAEIEHFTKAINGEEPLAITADDGVRSMEIICSVY